MMKDNITFANVTIMEKNWFRKTMHALLMVSIAKITRIEKWNFRNYKLLCESGTKTMGLNKILSDFKTAKYAQQLRACAILTFNFFEAHDNLDVFFESSNIQQFLKISIKNELLSFCF